jgi:addiction module RelB/DinJ family antitoxin
MSQMVELALEVDTDLEKQTEAIFAEYGLTLEEAAILFFNEVVRLKRLPFELDDDLLEYVRAHPIGGGNEE